MASPSPQHMGRCSSFVFHHKGSHHGCFGRPGAQGSAIAAYNPVGAQRCVLHRKGFSSSLFQATIGVTQVSTVQVNQQCWKEWMGWCTCKSVPKNAISVPILAKFLLIFSRWNWLDTLLAFTSQLYLLFWNCIIFIKLQIIPSYQNYFCGMRC